MFGGTAGPAGRAGVIAGDGPPLGPGVVGYDGVAGLAGPVSSEGSTLGSEGGDGAPGRVACCPGFLAELEDHMTSPTMMTSAATPPTPAIRPIGSERSSAAGVFILARAAAADGDMLGSAEPSLSGDFGFSAAGSDAGVT
jgi:hypothetical protein